MERSNDPNCGNRDGAISQAVMLHFALIRMLYHPGPKMAANGESNGTLTALLQQRARMFLSGKWVELWEAAQAAAIREPYQHDKVPDGYEDVSPENARRAKSLAEQGELSRAMAALSAKPLLNPTDPEVLSALRDMHSPQWHAPIVVPPVPNPPADLYTVEKYQYSLKSVKVKGLTEAVPTVKFVRAHLKNKVAQGPAGDRYEHYTTDADGGVIMAAVVNEFVYRIVNNSMPENVRILFSSSNLMATPKPADGSPRPIAIKSAISRIAARVVCLQEQDLFASVLSVTGQYGVAIPQGIEVAYHLSSLQLDYLLDGAQTVTPTNAKRPGMLKLDFINAFGSVFRGQIAKQLVESAPHLLRIFDGHYGRPTTQFVVNPETGKSEAIVLSECGAQQGDPLGSAFFALGIHKFCEDLQGRFGDTAIAWIIDDLTVTAPQDTLARVVEFCLAEGPKYGLQLHTLKGPRGKPGKSALYLPQGTALDQFMQMGIEVHNSGIPRIYGDGTSDGFKKLLGAPVGGTNFVSESALGIVNASHENTKQIGALADKQLEWLLLSYCAAPKIVHLARMVKHSTLGPAIHAHDAAIRGELDRMLAGDFRPPPQGIDDVRFRIAQLPVRDGGMGLHNMSLVSPGAMMASLAGVHKQLKKINDRAQKQYVTALLSFIPRSNDYTESRVKYESLISRDGADDHSSGSSDSLDDMAKVADLKQKGLSKEVYAVEVTRIRDSVGSRSFQAHFLSEAGEGAGDWLRVIPSGFKFFRAPSVTFVDMLRGRLFMDYLGAGVLRGCPRAPQSATCQSAQGEVISKGLHWKTSCKHGRVSTRSAGVKKILYEAMRRIHISCDLETLGLLQYGNQRPADLFVPAGGDLGNGADQVFDVTIVDPTAEGMLSLGSPQVALLAAREGEKKKVNDFAAAVRNQGGLWQAAECRPLAFESSGAWGPSALEILAELKALAQGLDLNNLKMSGLDYTWSANSFVSWYRQRVSFYMAKSTAVQVRSVITMARNSARAHRGGG